MSASRENKMSRTVRRIGLLIPAADPMSEADFHRHLPPSLTFHATRLYESETSTASTLDNLDELVGSAPQAAKLLALIEPELIVFCCTSASLYKGSGWDKEVARMITDAAEIPATTTSTCVIEAHKALGLNEVFMITPYRDLTNQLEANFFKTHGVEVTGFTSFNCDKSKDLGNITCEQIVQMALENRAAIEGAGGLFISCTALPAFDVIEHLEKELGVPVVSSNQATLWNTLRILKVDSSSIPGGRLFRLADTHHPDFDRIAGSA